MCSNDGMSLQVFSTLVDVEKQSRKDLLAQNNGSSCHLSHSPQWGKIDELILYIIVVL